MLADPISSLFSTETGAGHALKDTIIPPSLFGRKSRAVSAKSLRLVKVDYLMTTAMPQAPAFGSGTRPPGVLALRIFKLDSLRYESSPFQLHQPDFIVRSARGRSICHIAWGYVCPRSRTRVSSNEIFSIAHFSFVLHYNTAAATEPFDTISPKAAFQIIQLSNPSSVDCGKYPYLQSQPLTFSQFGQ